MAKAVGFCEKMTGSYAEAEDIVQMAFSRVWRLAPKWEPRAQFTTWFYKILYNLCIDYHRRQQKRQHVLEEEGGDREDPTQSQEEALLESERAVKVREAIAKLPERQRAAIILCYYEQKSQRESAAILEVTEKALESLLVRGRRQLKDELDRTLKRGLE